MFREHYNDCEVNVHGGLTFAGPIDDSGHSDLWWLGFDTNHFGDDAHTQSLSYVRGEVESLAEQLRALDPEVTP
jgi:hypothetical protein